VPRGAAGARIMMSQNRQALKDRSDAGPTTRSTSAPRWRSCPSTKLDLLRGRLAPALRCGRAAAGRPGGDRRRLDALAPPNTPV
jgi:hypothetical protein